MILRPIFPDQLSECLASLQDIHPETDILIFSEKGWSLTDKKHHPKKIAFLLSAQRHFINEWQEKGFTVLVNHWEATKAEPDLCSFVKAVAQHQSDSVHKIVWTQPSAATSQNQINLLQQQQPQMHLVLPDNRFYCQQKDFDEWAQGKRSFRMEFFYRMLRVRENILIEDDGSPTGGSWNYDAENRQPAKNCPPLNQTYESAPDLITQEVMNMLKSTGITGYFGDLEPFHYGVTRTHALEALDLFIKKRLRFFGDYQDVMRDDDPWLYHSHISLYMNAGLLLARECVDAAIAAYHRGQAPLNAVEGFVRQILGWREFVRGLYGYYQTIQSPMNALNAHRPLPALYWGEETRMRCLAQCVSDTKKKAYAHHIQRLMVLGNFALLCGLKPEEVDEWYLIVYADAYEWVEQPNVLGMILFADDGLLASKPYAASGAYIQKMSNYCDKCYYSVKEKTSERACPFHSLYWNFIHQHREKFYKNPRMAMIYKTFDKFTPEQKNLYLEKAKTFLEALERGEKV